MIKIRSLQIEEFRGIRNLTLELKEKNFAICGRNGTGKSGVVDAIEFALTGNISRLAGEGTDKLSVKEHAPHVDSRSDPAKAVVRLTLTIPSLKATVTISRSPKDPKKLTVTPSSAEILSVLRQIEEHPEIVLTRREIIRYVLAPEGKRAAEVQAVLRLERLGNVRQMLRTIANSSNKNLMNAKTAVGTAASALKRALRIPVLTEKALVAAVNERRGLLGLGLLSGLTPGSSLKEGVGAGGGPAINPAIPKSHALTDIAALRKDADRLAHLSDIDGKDAIAQCRVLLADPAALNNLNREEFLRTGLDFIGHEGCPFCDDKWSVLDLRAHVTGKLVLLEATKERRVSAERAIEPIIARFEESLDVARRILDYARVSRPPIRTTELRKWGSALARSKGRLEAFLPLDVTLATLETPPLLNAEAVNELLGLENTVRALPDLSKQEAAKEFLVIAQERLAEYRRARRVQLRVTAQAALAARVASTYATVLDTELDELYEVVQGDFTAMYSELNSPDEKDFAARLVPSIGKLGFDVNFYGRGMFPPGAYHSEGHQDAMGLCLYLALMSHVLKGGFQLAVLDDVLMSVDAGHRRAICTMLKKRFPETQFVITTHDPVWLNHMRTEGLINSKGLIQFRGWDVSIGPTAFGDADIWTEINKELAADRVSVGAELLRNHLEYIAGELCHRLAARTEHRLDERFELGMLLPPAYERLTSLYAKGKAAANSWGQKDIIARLTERQEKFGGAIKATGIDQWQMNAAIHYNSWASLQKQDFAPLVLAFKDLIDQFRCSECNAFLSILKDGATMKTVSCDCGQGNINLAEKA